MKKQKKKLAATRCNTMRCLHRREEKNQLTHKKMAILRLLLIIFVLNLFVNFFVCLNSKSSSSSNFDDDDEFEGSLPLLETGDNEREPHQHHHHHHHVNHVDEHHDNEVSWPAVDEESFSFKFPHVTMLFDSNFDELVTSSTSSSWILSFTVSNCDACKLHLYPVLEDSAVKLRGKLKFANIDCGASSGLCERYRVKKYPTVIFFRNGFHRLFPHPSTMSSFKSFSDQINSPAVVYPKSLKSFKSLRKQSDVTFVFIGPSTGTEQKTFHKQAFTLQGVSTFVHLIVDDGAKSKSSIEPLSSKVINKLLAKWDIDAMDLPVVVCLTQGTSPIKYSASFDSVSLHEFVYSNRLPLITPLTPYNAEEIVQIPDHNKLSAVIVLTSNVAASPSTVSTKSYLKQMRKVAKQFRNLYTFVSLDGPIHANYLGQFWSQLHNSSNLPTVFVLNYPDYFYINEERIETREQATAFIQGINNGSIASIGTLGWYNPMRYISRVDRYFGAQSEYYWTLVAAGLVMCTTILMFFCLYKFSGDDDEATLNAAEAAAAASIKTIKMRSTMSEANHLIDQTTIPSIAHAAKQRKK